jgi:hypothetical protein
MVHEPLLQVPVIVGFPNAFTCPNGFDPCSRLHVKSCGTKFTGALILRSPVNVTDHARFSGIPNVAVLREKISDALPVLYVLPRTGQPGFNTSGESLEAAVATGGIDWTGDIPAEQPANANANARIKEHLFIMGGSLHDAPSTLRPRAS